MERLPHLDGYPRGLSLGEHPNIPPDIGRALMGEDGWTDVSNRPAPHGSRYVRGWSERRLIPHGDGVVVKRAVSLRVVALAAAGAVAAVVAGVVWS